MISTQHIGSRIGLEYTAKSIGRIAFKALSQSQDGSVIGTTSRGIFIHVLNGLIMFLSFEAYRSPLTITLRETVDQLRLIEVGSRAEIAPGSLVFPSFDIAISAQDDALWRCPAPPHLARSFPEQLESLRYFAKAAEHKASLGFCALLQPLVGSPISSLLSDDLCSVLSRILLLRQALRDRRVSDASKILCSFLGMGGGLTPSGDDLILGLLLLLNRSRNLSRRRDDLRQLNRQVVGAAYRKTTILSANLIEYATMGEADERLVKAVDCILSGSPSESEAVSGLLGWGGSSGADALVGMAVGLTL